MRNLVTSREFVHNENALYKFKKTVEVKSAEKSVLKVYAEARYKMYINGTLVATGPCRGYGKEYFYDYVDITQYVNVGENEIYIELLQLNYTGWAKSKIFRMIRREGNMELAVWGNVGENETEADESWLVARENGVEFFEGIDLRVYGHYNIAALSEKISPSYGKCLKYENAELLRYDNPQKSQNMLRVRDEAEHNGYIGGIGTHVRRSPIPMMRFENREFFAENNGVYDAGELMCGYLRLDCHGKGKIKMTCAECKVLQEDGQYIKRMRDDENGVVIGDCDIIEVDGTCLFRPFWMRTFRYIKLEIEGDITIDNFDYIETGYPIEISDDYDFGNEKNNKLFEISARTLKRCMHEVYFDCPYYEQLQYAMDTYIQILFTYQLTEDKALPEKAIDDFANTYSVNSLTTGSCSTDGVQYIVGFALFYIYMLYEHYKRFSDTDFLKKYLHIGDGIINWFENHLDGYMVKRSAFWDFIDWAAEYLNKGTAPVLEPGAVYSLMLATALDNMTELHNALGDTITRYSALSENIKRDVRERCYDNEKKMYADGPSKSHFAQHTQIWSVLSGVEQGDGAREVLKNSMDLVCKASTSYAFLLVRALEKADMYDEADKIMDTFRAFVDLHCTTTPEWYGEDVRSECHAWSALALYEFTAKVLGVTYRDGKVLVKPYIANREFAKGSVATPKGMVYVDWNKNGDEFKINVKLPQDVKAMLTLPNGQSEEIAGEYEKTVAIK